VSGGGKHGELLDLVYDAALAPHLWTSVVERLAERVGGCGGMLVDQNVQTGRGEALVVGHDPSVLAPYFGYYASRNVLLRTPDARAFMHDWRPCILVDEDWLPKPELVRSEYYNDFLRPMDVHSVLMIRLVAHDLNAVNLNIGRSARAGPFGGGDLDVVCNLHPHLIRAFQLGRRIAAQRGLDAGAAEFLDRSPHAVFLVRPDGRVRHANPAAERLTAAGKGLSLAGGRLGSPDAAAGRRLQALIRQAASPDAERRGGGAMTIGPAQGRLPLSAIVAPVAAERLAMFGGEPSIIVCVTDPEAGVGPAGQRLRDAFGLTAAETRVAVALVEGDSPRKAAARLGVSFNTVRTHQARIYDKIGASRLPELVALVLTTLGAMIP
jgi:DNA-binding CsgD family transcriptional regulator/PAS domain-containing protein